MIINSETYKIMNNIGNINVILENGDRTQVFLTNEYLYWDNNSRLKCYNLESLVACKQLSETLQIVVFKNSKFRIYSFLCSDAFEFASQVNSLIFPESKHFLIIYNPVSGKGTSKKEFEKRLLPLISLTPYTYEVHESIQASIPEDLMMKIGKTITDIIFLSGDGTVHHILT